MRAHVRQDRQAALDRLMTQPLLEQLVQVGGCGRGCRAAIAALPDTCTPCPTLAQEHGAVLCVHFIGALPARQGQGLGSAMLRHFGRLADERQLHSYIEASTDKSRVRRSRGAVRGSSSTGPPLAHVAPTAVAALSLRVQLSPATTCALPSQALYARHGFVHVADKPLGDAADAATLRVMVRPPHTAAGAGSTAD